jgi:hypothetical protein
MATTLRAGREPHQWNAAFLKSWFAHWGRVSLLDTLQRLQRIS